MPTKPEPRRMTEGELGPEPWPCPTGDPHLVFTRRDGTVVPHVGASGHGCPANDKPYKPLPEMTPEQRLDKIRFDHSKVIQPERMITFLLEQIDEREATIARLNAEATRQNRNK